MAGKVKGQPRYGVAAACPVCHTAFFVCYPEDYVYKREATISRGNHKTIYFNKYSCKKKFDEEYDKYIFEVRQAAAKERHEQGRAKRQAIAPEVKAARDAEIDKLREGKCCKDCLYSYRDKFGFYYCSFNYCIKAYKMACKRYKPKDEGVMYG